MNGFAVIRIANAADLNVICIVTPLGVLPDPNLLRSPIASTHHSGRGPSAPNPQVIRGLVIDRKLGNIVKADRFGSARAHPPLLLPLPTFHSCCLGCVSRLPDRVPFAPLRSPHLYHQIPKAWRRRNRLTLSLAHPARIRRLT
eukprot:9489193-Pyramimonas_sp.AAC.2